MNSGESLKKREESVASLREIENIKNSSSSLEKPDGLNSSARSSTSSQSPSLSYHQSIVGRCSSSSSVQQQAQSSNDKRFRLIVRLSQAAVQRLRQTVERRPDCLRQLGIQALHLDGIRPQPVSFPVRVSPGNGRVAQVAARIFMSHPQTQSQQQQQNAFVQRTSVAMSHNQQQFNIPCPQQQQPQSSNFIKFPPPPQQKIYVQNTSCYPQTHDRDQIRHMLMMNNNQQQQNQYQQQNQNQPGFSSNFQTHFIEQPQQRILANQHQFVNTNQYFAFDQQQSQQSSNTLEFSNLQQLEQQQQQQQALLSNDQQKWQFQQNQFVNQAALSSGHQNYTTPQNQYHHQQQQQPPPQMIYYQQNVNKFVASGQSVQQPQQVPNHSPLLANLLQQQSPPGSIVCQPSSSSMQTLLTSTATVSMKKQPQKSKKNAQNLHTNGQTASATVPIAEKRTYKRRKSNNNLVDQQQQNNQLPDRQLSWECLQQQSSQQNFAVRRQDPNFQQPSASTASQSQWPLGCPTLTSSDVVSGTETKCSSPFTSYGQSPSTTVGLDAHQQILHPSSVESQCSSRDASINSVIDSVMHRVIAEDGHNLSSTISEASSSSQNFGAQQVSGHYYVDADLNSPQQRFQQLKPEVGALSVSFDQQQQQQLLLQRRQFLQQNQNHPTQFMFQPDQQRKIVMAQQDVINQQNLYSAGNPGPEVVQNFSYQNAVDQLTDTRFQQQNHNQTAFFIQDPSSLPNQSYTMLQQHQRTLSGQQIPHTQRMTASSGYVQQSQHHNWSMDGGQQQFISPTAVATSLNNNKQTSMAMTMAGGNGDTSTACHVTSSHQFVLSRNSVGVDSQSTITPFFSQQPHHQQGQKLVTNQQQQQQQQQQLQQQQHFNPANQYILTTATATASTVVATPISNVLQQKHQMVVQNQQQQQQQQNFDVVNWPPGAGGVAATAVVLNQASTAKAQVLATAHHQIQQQQPQQSWMFDDASKINQAIAQPGAISTSQTSLFPVVTANRQ